MRRSCLALFLVLAMSSLAVADPITHLRTPSQVHTDGGSDLKFPPGYFLDELRYAALDAEMKRLQDAETRLKAENQSFRGSMASWQPGWYTATVLLVTGFALGAYAVYKL